MIGPESFIDAFALNLNIIQRQTEGLTHSDSLLQPPCRGNCLNWVLGHIAVNRDRVLQLLGEEAALSEAEAARYTAGSKPVTGEEEDILSLDELLDALQRAQAGIAAALGRATPADLTVEMETGARTMTVAQRLFGLYFHETYHTGQTELLRQLAGTDDKVV